MICITVYTIHITKMLPSPDTSLYSRCPLLLLPSTAKLLYLPFPLSHCLRPPCQASMPPLQGKHPHQGRQHGWWTRPSTSPMCLNQWSLLSPLGTWPTALLSWLVFEKSLSFRFALAPLSPLLCPFLDCNSFPSLQMLEAQLQSSDRFSSLLASALP